METQNLNLLKQRTSQTFYDAWEEATPSARKEHQKKQLDQFLSFCQKNIPAYASKVTHYQPDQEHPLLKVSPLQSDDIRELVPPVSRQLLSHETEDFTVFQSGGTTGFPKTTLFSHAELEALNLPNARGFFAMGLESTDRVGNLFAVGGLYMTFVHINRMLQQFGCMNFPFSNQTAVEFIHQATQLYKINCFTGITSVVLNALRGFKELGLGDIGIKKVYYGGEHIYPADKEELKKDFGVELIGAPGYGTVESWYIGYQCQHSQTGEFHCHDDQMYMEIINEETGEPCGPGEIGMLYVTPYVRTLTPILRYRVGDRAQWIENCECGRTTPRFRLLGRGDDVLRIGYDSVDYNAIQELVLGFKQLSGTIQIQKSRIEGKDQLTIRIEAAEEINSPEELQNQFKEKLRSTRPTIDDHLKKGTIQPIIVEILPQGTIPRNPRTGKLMRVIDAI